MSGSRPDADACAGLRAEVAALCSEALRLAETAGERASEMRRERQTGLELERRQAAARFGEPGGTARAKEDAFRRYRDSRERRPGAAGTQAAAAEWLREVDRLNRLARSAAPPTSDAVPRQSASQSTLDRLAILADAARIAAEEAAEACQAARARLARCEEQHNGARGGTMIEPDSAVVALVRGEEEALERLAAALAERAAVPPTESRRLLGLLAGAIADSALESGALVFPDGHHFWRQFPVDDARRVAVALAGLGNGFDGRGGWQRGRPADHRTLAGALAEVGYDFRGMHIPRQDSEMSRLWDGTAVDAAGFLARRAPDLALDAVISLVGRRAAALGGLWDRWGSARPLLLAPDRVPPLP